MLGKSLTYSVIILSSSAKTSPSTFFVFVIVEGLHALSVLLDCETANCVFNASFVFRCFYVDGYLGSALRLEASGH
jgi:hypothetical protein